MELRDTKKVQVLILVVVICWGLTIPLVKSQGSLDKQMGVVGSTPVVSQDQNLSVLFIGFTPSSIDSQSILGAFDNQISLYDSDATEIPIYTITLSPRIRFASESFAQEFTLKAYQTTKNDSSVPQETKDYWSLIAPGVSTSNYLSISPRDLDSSLAGLLRTSNDTEGESLSKLVEDEYSLIIANLFFDGSPFYTNNTPKIHFLDFAAEDLDTKQESQMREEAPYGVAFGGKYRFLGLVVSSGPGGSSINEFLNSYSLFGGFKSKNEWCSLLRDLLRGSVRSRLLPTYFYGAFPHKKLYVNIQIFTDSTVQFDPVDYISEITLENSLGSLLLGISENVDVRINEESLETSELLALKTKIAAPSTSDYFTWIEDIAAELEGSPQEYFSWSPTNILPLSRSLTYDDPVLIPVAVFISDLSYWIQSGLNYGVGHTPPQDSDSSLAGPVVLTFDPSFIQEDQEGLTQSILHEIGHVLGLRHPHDFWDEAKNKLEVHWTWGYTDTPMGYSHSDYSFDRFDRDALLRVYTSRFLNSSLYNLYLAKIVYEAGGTSWETSPSNFQVDYDTSMGILLQGLSDLSDGRPSEYEGILTDFIDAYQTSMDLLGKVIPDNGGNVGLELSQWLMPLSLGVILVFGFIIYKKKREDMGYQNLQRRFPSSKKTSSNRSSRRGRVGSAYNKRKRR